MAVVSFLHQKGGTGKSSLAIGSAVALARAGHKVLLYDTDGQGTSAEWANRYGRDFGVECVAQNQPRVEEEVAKLAGEYPWILIDAPPSLSPMTESVIRAEGRLIIPVRPAQPDIWALSWLAALIKKLSRDHYRLQPLVVVNQYQNEPLEPLLEPLPRLGLAAHPQPIPFHPAFPALFQGQPLPPPLEGLLLRLIGHTP